jgi:hypothetical protein
VDDEDNPYFPAAITGDGNDDVGGKQLAITGVDNNCYDGGGKPPAY